MCPRTRIHISSDFGYTLTTFCKKANFQNSPTHRSSTIRKPRRHEHISVPFSNTHNWSHLLFFRHRFGSFSLAFRSRTHSGRLPIHRFRRHTKLELLPLAYLNFNLYPSWQWYSASRNELSMPYMSFLEIKRKYIGGVRERDKHQENLHVFTGEKRSVKYFRILNEGRNLISYIFAGKQNISKWLSHRSLALSPSVLLVRAKTNWAEKREELSIANFILNSYHSLFIFSSCRVKVPLIWS
jgi:hypothetical protein